MHSFKTYLFIHYPWCTRWYWGMMFGWSLKQNSVSLSAPVEGVVCERMAWKRWALSSETGSSIYIPDHLLVLWAFQMYGCFCVYAGYFIRWPHMCSILYCNYKRKRVIWLKGSGYGILEYWAQRYYPIQSLIIWKMSVLGTPIEVCDFLNIIPIANG